MEMEILEYIETYFGQTMPENERMHFEERISADQAFANEVAFYISARQTVKHELLLQKQADWSADNLKEELAPTAMPIRKVPISKWWSYVAAACLLLFAAFYLFEKRDGTPQQLANNYVTKELAHTSITMDGGGDSLQLGKDAYNDKNYDKALQYFTGLANAHTENTEAKKMIGIVYLVTRNYDKALEQFDELANVKGLFSNPGLFYKAVTLMERNKAGDVKQAKELLEQVVKQNLGHSEEAAEWLKKF